MLVDVVPQHDFKLWWLRAQAVRPSCVIANSSLGRWELGDLGQVT